MANTQTSVPVFTAGQVLTAAQQNLINTGIPVFADSTARDAAFGGTGEKTLAEGQFAFLEDTNATQFYDGAGWQSLTVGARIGQVVSATKTDTFTAATTTYTDITGLSVTITPTLATSKVFVLAFVQGSQDVTVQVATLQLVRDSTAIAVADAAGNRIVGTSPLSGSDPSVMGSNSLAFLDSPATTSATTYKIQGRSNAAADTFFINRSDLDTNNTVHNRVVSTIAVFEVIV